MEATHITFKPRSGKLKILNEDNDDDNDDDDEVELCVKDIHNCMVHNGLKLNQDKSGFLLFTSRFRRGPVLNSLTVFGEEIKSTSSARNLGTVFDTHVTFSKSVNTPCKISNFHLKYLSEETTEISSNALFLPDLITAIQYYMVCQSTRFTNCN